MEIIVCEANKEKIRSIIKEKEGKARERTIDYSDVTYAINCIENKLKGTLKKNWEGVMVECDIHSQSFPKAYKYTPYSTQFGLIRKGGKWRISWIIRGICDRYNQRFRMANMPDELKANILETYKVF